MALAAVDPLAGIKAPGVGPRGVGATKGLGVDDACGGLGVTVAALAPARADPNLLTQRIVDLGHGPVVPPGGEAHAHRLPDRKSVV